MASFTRMQCVAAGAWALLAIIFLGITSLQFSFSTEWGRTQIPDLLLKYHVLEPRLVEYLRSILQTKWLATARTVEAEIRSHTGPNEPVLLVSDPEDESWRLRDTLTRLQYDLVPQPATVVPKAEADEAARRGSVRCRLNWYSDSDITLLCPGVVWSNRRGSAP